ncbi:MAG: GNAT family N-acetyltransferase [Gemmataceae bacterium]
MLRPTTPADTPALLAITAGTGVFKPHEVGTLEDVLDDFHREGAEYGHVCLTLEDGGVAVGFVYFTPVAMTDRTWELWWIVVDKGRQGRGTGRWLLVRVEQHILQLGGRLLLIETSSTPHYEPTRQFYLNTGYTLAAQIPDFYCDGDDKCIFRKRLSPAAV